MKTSAAVDRPRQLHVNTKSQRGPGRNGLAEPIGAIGKTTRTEQETQAPQVIGVGHVALSAQDPVALAEFYRHVLGFQVVPTETSDLGENVFLSGDSAGVSVDLALFANPDFQHTAFEVHSLADLRAFHQRVLGRGVHVKMALNHGVSLSFYFHDPDGHLVEVYWSTGIDCLPRHGDPIDLMLSEESLRRSVPELATREALTN